MNHFNTHFFSESSIHVPFSFHIAPLSTVWTSIWEKLLMYNIYFDIPYVVLYLNHMLVYILPTFVCGNIFIIANKECFMTVILEWPLIFFYKSCWIPSFTMSTNIMFMSIFCCISVFLNSVNNFTWTFLNVGHLFYNYRHQLI